MTTESIQPAPVPTRVSVPQNPNALNRAAVIFALDNDIRWGFLDMLVKAGEPLSVAECAQAMERDASLVSKHAAILRDAGLIVSGRGNLYRIPAQFIPTPGQPVVDYGFCVLRFNLAPLA